MWTSKWQNTLVSSLQKRLSVAPPTTERRGRQFGVLVSYAGTVDGDLINHLVHLAECSLSHFHGTRQEQKRVVYVLIEAAQNVIHHGYIDEHGETVLYLTVESTPVGYQVHCGNFLDSATAEELCERLGELNTFDKAALRKAYITALCDGTTDSLRSKAGLGLISMAKRTHGPIEFQTEPHSDGVALFTLTVTVRP